MIPMGHVERVSSNFGARGDQVYLDPVQLLRLVVIFAPQYGELRPFPQNLLAGIKGEITRGAGKRMVEIGGVEQ